MISLTSGIENTPQMNISTKQKQTHRHGQHIYGFPDEGGEKWDGWEVWGL